MKARITQFILISGTLAAWIFGFGGAGGCTTAEVAPQPAPVSMLPPPYVQVPHPAGYDLADLRAIFTDRTAPKPDDLKGCEEDLKKLKTLTQSDDEITQGTRELIRRDPVRYHWCFYGKILQLEADLKSESYLDERQKKVLDTYGFLTPVGRAFIQEYHDSRYMRWAVRHYKQISEWVFYRKLELTPQATSDLVEASNPFGLLREPAGPVPVLEKYNIARPADTIPATVPVGTAQAVQPAQPVDPAPAERLPAAESVTTTPAAAVTPVAPGIPILQSDGVAPADKTQ
jgi:hypothetical protein